LRESGYLLLQGIKVLLKHLKLLLPGGLTVSILLGTPPLRVSGPCREQECQPCGQKERNYCVSDRAKHDRLL
jgi:hypothetical protein